LEKYGKLWQYTSLTCDDVTITNATRVFTFKQNGAALVIDGKVFQPTKYIVTINVGSIVLIIKNTSTSDEGEYTCSIDFVEESPPYNLKLKVSV